MREFDLADSIHVTYETNDMGLDWYTWDTGFGPTVFEVRDRERAFIQWAVEQGHEQNDAILVMAESGDDGDCPMELCDAWTAWSAGLRYCGDVTLINKAQLLEVSLCSEPIPLPEPETAMNDDELKGEEQCAT